MFADVLRSLDPTLPAHVAFMTESTVLLRGSGYVAFDDEVPSQPAHAGVGAPYAHTTAPLRRLVDRYVGEVCVAVSAGREVPEWVQPPCQACRRRWSARTGGHSGTRPGSSPRSRPQCWRSGSANVRSGRRRTDDHDGGGTVQLVAPAVTAHATGELPLGERVTVRLTLADVAKRQIRFELV